jgi:ribosome recycling factor
MVPEVEHEARHKMEAAVEALRVELASIRTGRASPALLEHIHVDYYGTPTSMQQLAGISVPEPNQLLIRPWDKASLKAIEHAIQTSDLGLTPNNDGQVIRLLIPLLTEERRRDLARIIAKRVEEGRVVIRNIRRDSLKDLKDLEGEKLITEDEHEDAKERLQKLTDDYIKRIEDVGSQKHQEIMQG